MRSLNVEKYIFRPPKDDEDILGPETPYLVGYSMQDTGSDPHIGRDQTGYVFSHGGESYDVYAGNEDRQLYIWTTTCIAQLREGFIKGDRMKHISTKFLFTNNLQKDCDKLFKRFVQATI
ncbi:hypothetical protein Tco_0146081 [Tanacetum coccineum]